MLRINGGAVRAVCMGITCAAWLPAAGPVSAAAFEFMGMTQGPAGGFVNPALLVGFNPQPDPPGSLSSYDDRDPHRLRFHTRSMHPHFSILLGLELPAVQGQFFGHEGNVPNHDGLMQFGWDGGPGQMYMVRLQLFTSSPLDRTSWVGFNPQPEPPAFPSAVQFNFSMMGVARGESPPEGDRYFATLALEIWNGDERIPFEFVPGPGSVGLLACAGVMAAGRRLCGVWPRFPAPRASPTAPARTTP